MGINYNRAGDFCTIVIKDTNDNIIFKRRINLLNRQEYFDVMFSIAEKYGFKPEIDIGNDVNTKEKIKDEQKKELEWFS